MTNEIPTVIESAPNAGVVQTPEIRQTVKRAVGHIEAGHPVYVHGDDEFTTSDFVACLRSEIRNDSRGISVDLAAGKGICAALVKGYQDDE